MLDRERLARAFAKLHSERPSAWRDELPELDALPTRGPFRRLKYATMTEVFALAVVLKDVGSLTNAEAEYRERFWRRLALRRRLKLASDDCYGKPPNPACKCGGEAIDALPDDELGPLNLMQARARVLVLAKEKHQRTPQPRKPKPKPASLPTGNTAATPLAEMPPGHLHSPPQPRQPSPETSEPPPSPQPRPRPVKRTSKWFDEDERRSITDYIF
jgi:hypothetical protein